MKVKLFAVAFSIFVVASCKTSAPKVTDTQNDPNQSAKKEIAVEPSAGKPVQGKDLFENHCGNCHGLYQPKDFTKEAWAPILVEMQRKARLSDDQMALISGYIYEQL